MHPPGEERAGQAHRPRIRRQGRENPLRAARADIVRDIGFRTWGVGEHLRRGEGDRSGDAAVVALPELDEVVTPALIVDRARLLTNIQEMAARAASLGVALRPHAKTHKSPAIAGLQREHGAAGLTVATITEAEGFAAEGIDDLVLTAPPVGDWRLERLVALSRRAGIRVVVDGADALASLALIALIGVGLALSQQKGSDLIICAAIFAGGVICYFGFLAPRSDRYGSHLTVPEHELPAAAETNR